MDAAHSQFVFVDCWGKIGSQDALHKGIKCTGQIMYQPGT